jgi:hypothetical protein
VQAPNIGAEIAAKAPPDGYTIFLGNVAHTINVTLYRKLSYDIVSDFAPITLLAFTPNILVVHPSVPVKFVKMKLKRMGGIDQTLAASERAWQLGLSVCLDDGVATEIGCWMEACIARLAISTAGEMNGFLKPKVRLFVDPLPYEAAAIVLKPGFWPVIDRKVLAAHTIAVEKFATVRVA